jgi:2-keto-3-deoxy-L-rhamnonate aldolase RhmA
VSLNAIKQRCETGDASFGTFTYSPDPALVEIAASAGFDFVIVDTEHGQLDAGDVTSLIRTARGEGMTPFVRVGDPNAHSVGRALDAGAAGVMLPHVNDELMAQELTAAARFAPAGIRSACTCSPATNYSFTPFATYARAADEQTWVMGLIEDKAGVDRIDEIIQIAGLDVVMPGISDLAASLGVPGELDHPLVLDAVERIADRVGERPDVELALYVSSPQQVSTWAARGVKIFVYSIDYKLVAGAYAAARSELMREFEMREVAPGGAK